MYFPWNMARSAVTRSIFGQACPVLRLGSLDEVTRTFRPLAEVVPVLMTFDVLSAPPPS